MKLDRYEFEASNNFTTYEFVSEGKKGRVIKVVQFEQFIGPGIYNLAFGDKDPDTGYFDDLVITNNGDTEKLLATVVIIIYKFTERFPGTSSTDARTRLYRMFINKFLDIILKSFTILGENQNQLEVFEKNKKLPGICSKKNNSVNLKYEKKAKNRSIFKH